MTTRGVALVTGAGRGLGRHAALAFSREGYRVVATARNRPALQSLKTEAASERLALNCFELDLNRHGDFPRLLQRVMTEEGALHVIVNCAGIHHFGALENVTAAELETVMATNFVGPMMLFRSALPYFRRQGGGRILAVSSLSGLAGTACDGAYSASKHALEGAVEALSHEVDRWNIHLALIYFGRLDTDMMRITSDMAPADGAYRPLEESLLRRHQAGADTAESASMVAAQLPRIAEAMPGPLRRACDSTARLVFGRLGINQGSERERLLREVDGTAWWRDGESCDPDSEDRHPS